MVCVVVNSGGVQQSRVIHPLAPTQIPSLSLTPLCSPEEMKGKVGDQTK